jgi:hypothetical protein
MAIRDIAVDETVKEGKTVYERSGVRSQESGV